jgi:hypothetical protein
MELISYTKFAKLSLESFFPKSKIRKVGPSAECALGYGGGQSVGFTAVFWPDSSPGTVGELQLDMRRGECPAKTALEIMQAVALPLAPGDSEKAVLKALGAPDHAEPYFSDERFCRFLIGVRHPYVIGCHVHKSTGLNGLMVVRKDYWARAQS